MDIKFSLEFQWTEFARLSQLDVRTAPRIQIVEMRRAFFGGIGRILTLMLEDISALPENEAVDVMELMFDQVKTFWLNETNRQN